MTNLEYIKSQLGNNYPLDDDFFTNTLVVDGLMPDDDFVKGKDFDLAFINALWMLIGSAKRISEGGYTVEIDTTALLKLISMLYRKWGLDDLTKDGYVTGKPTYTW